MGLIMMLDIREYNDDYTGFTQRHILTWEKCEQLHQLFWQHSITNNYQNCEPLLEYRIDQKELYKIFQEIKKQKIFDNPQDTIYTIKVLAYWLNYYKGEQNEFYYSYI